MRDRRWSWGDLSNAACLLLFDLATVLLELGLGQRDDRATNLVVILEIPNGAGFERSSDAPSIFPLFLRPRPSPKCLAVCRDAPITGEPGALWGGHHLARFRMAAFVSDGSCGRVEIWMQRSGCGAGFDI